MRLFILIGLFLSSNVRAEYMRFEISDGFFIDKQCSFRGRRETSRIKLFLPPVDWLAEDLVITHSKVRVCVQGELVRDDATLVIPYKEILTHLGVNTKSSGGVSFSQQLMRQDFGSSSPNYLTWKLARRTKTSYWVDLEYFQHNQSRLGPISVELVDPKALQGAPGFDVDRHPGLRSLHVPVPGSSVVLRSKFVQVQPD